MPHQDQAEPRLFWTTGSIPWLLMPWLLASPGHQQPWHWQSEIGRSDHWNGTGSWSAAGTVPSSTADAISTWRNDMKCKYISMSKLILGLRPANERLRYFVTTSLIGWAQTQNHPCMLTLIMSTWSRVYSSHVPTSTTDAISIWRNDMKCKYISMFAIIMSTRSRVDSSHVTQAYTHKKQVTVRTTILVQYTISPVKWQ